MVDEFNIRDASGQPNPRRRAVYGRTSVEVPSFGETIDSHLDLFGYEVSVILALHTVWASAGTAQYFIHLMGEHNMPAGEAIWFWNEMMKEGGSHHYHEQLVMIHVD